ncbi:MAG: phenylalanine--tRNA ligase subunit alpha, partial [Burkholderiales bacterium]|nr:phenylalanine--tRNA ligase subunit alpha [Burkholderiales bacterium]
MASELIQLTDMVTKAQADFAAATDLPSLENAKARYLGKSGLITEHLKTLGKVPPQERVQKGAVINEAKTAIEAALAGRRQALSNAKMEAQLHAEAIDVSLPGRGVGGGGLHPITRTRMRIEALFRSQGFDVADGPEIEDDTHNFAALNMPDNHPARS